MKRLLAVLMFIASTAGAQDVNHDGEVTYLVPLSLPSAVSGAFGTRWRTELWVHNEWDYEVALRPCGPPGSPLPCYLAAHPPYRTTLASALETSTKSGTLVFDVPVSAAPRLSLSCRLFETSRGAQPAGVDIPVVREDRFVAGTLRLLGVPSSSGRRATLRLYDPRRAARTVLHVAAVDLAGFGIAEHDVALEAPPSVAEPSYAAFDLRELFPAAQTGEAYDVVISPRTPGAEYWAMVSVTDNETQQVVVITDPTPATVCASAAIFQGFASYEAMPQPESEYAGTLRRDCQGPTFGGRDFCYFLDGLPVYHGNRFVDAVLAAFVGRSVVVRGKVQDIGYGRELAPASISCRN